MNQILHTKISPASIYANMICISAVVASLTLTACTYQTRASTETYQCELSSLSMCDQKHLACSPVPIISSNQPFVINFDPINHLVTVYEGDDILNEDRLEFWEHVDDTIFLGGHNINIKGDATTWTSLINTNSGEMIMSALSLNYSYIIMGTCQQHD
jgi:hypothetical protein